MNQESFWNKVRRFLKKPLFPDAEKTQSAQLLWRTIIVINGLMILLTIIFDILLPEEALTNNLFALLLFCSSMGILWLINQGRVALAGHIFCNTLLIIIVVNAFLYGGIRNVNILPYFVLISICGLLVGKRGLRIYTAASVVSLVILYLLELNGILQTEYITIIQIEELLLTIFMVLIVASLLHSAINTINNGYTRLQNALSRLQETTVSKDNLDKIIDSMGDMLFVFDKSLTLSRVNKIVASRFDHTASQLEGVSFTNLLEDPEPIQNIITNWSDTTRVHTLESQLWLGANEKIDVLFQISSVGDEFNGKTQFVCVAHDITARNATEQALRQAVNKAEEAASAKANFLASMSHEIRTPLNAVLGMASLLETTPLTLEQLNFLSTIQQSGKLLEEVIGNILDFSKIESGHIEFENKPFHILECVLGAIDIAREGGQKPYLPIEKEIDASVPTILSGDLYRLQQVLINILNNAIKFTLDGHISVGVNGRFVDDQCELTFKVSDSGIGITADRLESIFHQFHQGDSSITRRFGGTGIGLAICKRIVTLMGGKIWVESKLGEGSIFYFTAVLNPVDELGIPSSQPGTSSKKAISHPLNILITDDNKINLKVSSIMLSRLGHSIDAAYSGAEAITAATSKSYDIIFMDIQMPEMDGIETTRRIKDHFAPSPSPPIIALTANALPSDKENFLKAGLDGYISKPVRIETFEETIADFFPTD